MSLSAEPINVRRRWRRKLAHLERDRLLFLSRYVGHSEAARMYDNERDRIGRKIRSTYGARYLRRLEEAAGVA